MNLQLFADTTSTDNTTTVLTSTPNPVEGWIKGDIHCYVTNENNFLLVRLLSLLDNSMKVWDITYNTDGGVNTFKCLDGNGTCTYDSNNLLTGIKIFDENSSTTDEIQLEYDPTTKFISSYKKIKYNCDGKTIITSLDPNYTSKSTLNTKTQTALNSGCYNFSNMSYMFNNCNKLTTVDVSNLDTSKVTNMHKTFSNCRALTTLDASKWDTSNVTDMYGMFEYCNSLTTLDLSNWDTSNVIDMYGMFYGCYKLTTLDLSNWDTSNVTSMSGMFNNCYKLATLDVSNWDTSNVTDMNEMFRECSSLKNIIGTIDMKSCTSYSNMFAGCTNLTAVKLRIIDAFKCATAFNPSCTNIDATNWDISNVTNMKSIFEGCGSLTTLDVSNWDTTNVTNMMNMFNNCSALTTVDVSKWNTSSVTNMSGMFEFCSALTTLDTSDWDTSNVTDMGNMFNNCANLTTITGVIDMKSCTSYGDMFSNCYNLTGVKIKNPPSGITATSGIGGLAAGKYEIVS